MDAWLGTPGADIRTKYRPDLGLTPDAADTSNVVRTPKAASDGVTLRA